MSPHQQSWVEIFAGKFLILVVNRICRIIGAVLILVGLYLVVWGKNEEGKFAARKAGIPSVTASSLYMEKDGKSSISELLLPSSIEASARGGV